MKYHEYQTKHPLLYPYIEYYNSMEGKGLHGKKFISLPEGKIGLVFFNDGNIFVAGYTYSKEKGLKDIILYKFKFLPPKFP